MITILCTSKNNKMFCHVEWYIQGLLNTDIELNGYLVSRGYIIFLFYILISGCEKCIALESVLIHRDTQSLPVLYKDEIDCTQLSSVFNIIRNIIPYTVADVTSFVKQFVVLHE